MDNVTLWYAGQCIGILGTVAAIIGGGIAAWKAISEWRRATEQRAEELKQRKTEFRQKQAVLARQIIKEVFADKRAFEALTMLEFTEYEYKDPVTDNVYHIHRSEIQKTLRMEDDNDAEPDKATFIRRTFEGLYDHLEQVQNLLDVDVLNIEDVKVAFRYYMRLALKPEVEHIWFLQAFDYPGAERFMRTLGSAKLQRQEPCRSSGVSDRAA